MVLSSSSLTISFVSLLLLGMMGSVSVPATAAADVDDDDDEDDDDDDDDEDDDEDDDDVATVFLILATELIPTDVATDVAPAAVVVVFDRNEKDVFIPGSSIGTC